MTVISDGQPTASKKSLAAFSGNKVFVYFLRLVELLAL